LKPNCEESLSNFAFKCNLRHYSKSGGGKTTVISLLLRYYDVKGGSIAFDGVDLREMNLGSVHKHIGRDVAGAA